jgi:hypothetical protein
MEGDSREEESLGISERDSQGEFQGEIPRGNSLWEFLDGDSL